MKRLKIWSILFAVILTIACDGNNSGCRQCGFNPGEQVQNVGTGGAQFYYADTSGCVNISNADCPRVKLQNVAGTKKV